MPDSQDSVFESAILLPVELTIHDHKGRKTERTLHKLPAIIGRDEGADVLLTDPWISHRHCQIDVMCQLESKLRARSFFIMDENFLLGRKRALRLLELMEEHDKAWSLYVFTSA